MRHTEAFSVITNIESAHTEFTPLKKLLLKNITEISICRTLYIHNLKRKKNQFACEFSPNFRFF